MTEQNAQPQGARAADPLLETIMGVVDAALEAGQYDVGDDTFSGRAWEWYVAKHGPPQNLADVRRIFEFAIRLDRSTAKVLTTLGYPTSMIDVGLEQH